MIILDSWPLGGEYIHISMMNNFKQGVLYLLMLHMVH